MDVADGVSDVAIIGAGLTGTVTAATLGQSGMRVVLLDAKHPCPHCFKAEKIGLREVDQFRRLGLMDCLNAVGTRIRENQDAWNGTIVSRSRHERYGVFYHDLVNDLRWRLPASVTFNIGKVCQLKLAPDWQQVILDNGQRIVSRIVLLTSGPSTTLLRQLQITKRFVSAMHCVAFGFSVAPAQGTSFDFDELTYWGGGGDSHVAYLTFFPIGSVTRVNLIAYWGAGDQRTRAVMNDPVAALDALVPAVRKVTRAFRTISCVEAAAIHLHELEGHVQNGLAVLGDAFQNTCPAAGTGVAKALNDVECLTRHHLPGWLATPGMDVGKIAQFYSDSRKVALDRASLRLAVQMRRTSVDPAFHWRLRRTVRDCMRSLLARTYDWRQRLIEMGYPRP